MCFSPQIQTHYLKRNLKISSSDSSRNVPLPWVAVAILPLQMIWDSPFSHLLQGSFTDSLPFLQQVTRESGPLTYPSPPIPATSSVSMCVLLSQKGPGSPMLFPAFLLCPFLAPSFCLFPQPWSWRHYSYLEGIPSPSSWAGWKWDLWGTACSCHLTSPFCALPPPCSMGCRDFAPGLRWSGAEQEVGTAPPALLQLQGCLRVSKSALRWRGTSRSFLSLQWQAVWHELTAAGLSLVLPHCRGTAERNEEADWLCPSPFTNIWEKKGWCRGRELAVMRNRAKRGCQGWLQWWSNSEIAQ